jgi:RNase H-like domain found in reverse transcriptase
VPVAGKLTGRRVDAAPHRDPRATLSLMVDASDTHVGGGSAAGIATWFFSKKLTAAQSRYSTFDRELLACHDAIRHFRWSLEGREFCIYTDHKPLTHALARASDPWTPRQQRHLSFVAEYTADIRHVSVVNNNVAEALSRPPVAAVAPADGGEVDHEALAADQATCEATQQLARSSSLVVVRLSFGGTSMLCDVSTPNPRPLVPVAWQRRVFQAVHGLAHPGRRATRQLVTSRFIWQG